MATHNITVIVRNGMLYGMVLHTKYIVTLNLKFQKIIPLGGYFLRHMPRRRSGSLNSSACFDISNWNIETSN